VKDPEIGMRIKMNDKHFLFVYGTLLDPHIQMTVFGRVIEGTRDRLLGYKVIKKKFLSGIYPAVLKSNSSIAEGMVLTLSENELYRGDQYEGDEYTRVEVLLESGSVAWIYIPV
jgi:gamma-glutamylcyclotransferase (GGCT)/AIG2-like uncharacterized protein YtfP